jgi:uncharacterized protein (UPF0297 family)
MILYRVDMDKSDFTMQFNFINNKRDLTKAILNQVYDSLKEKGYNPVNQLVGYLISGDPTYITNYNGARALVRKLERDEILEEVLKSYLGIK